MSRYQLSDRYTATRGTVVLTGIQALARLPIEQLRADRRDGHTTAAFVSGYPGSPLGGFDSAVGAAAGLVPDLPIVCRPALNEEYAATAVMGSQLASGLPDARYDGVVGIWYGKAPGVDRAADALRHAGYAGTSALGGAVALVGDDPTAKSSTLPSSSAGVLGDLHFPLLYPADPIEALDLGRHAVALSRCTGLWTALKIVADVADGTATLELDPDRVRPVQVGDAGERLARRPEGRLLTPRTLDIERDIYERRYRLAVEYATANGLNSTTVDPSDAWIGIVSSGITYLELREALSRIGLPTDADVAAAGIRLFRMQMPIPFDPAGVRSFARGLEEVFVVEEKHPNVETLVKDALYSLADRPRVVGKRDDEDRPLVPGFGGLDADSIAPALRARLGRRLADRLVPPPPAPRALIPLAVQRAPFYCSGCPHNRSTEVPGGSLVGAGIGCHTMTLFMEPERVGDVVGLTPMGNEGTQWIGMEPFVERDHFIQNLGDGTYFHSGQLAVTAAIAAGIDITYKLLVNGAVAMTGGQHPQGGLAIEQVVANLLNQGAARVLITTDDPERYTDRRLPAGVEVWHRDRLLEAQEQLARIKGVTVLVHDQACAAESRRSRRRGLVPTPTTRLVINQRVCEGCGDCGRVSNCLSVQPIDTPYGRKTTIDQTTCNLDYSCLEGDCPSFVAVDTSKRRRRPRRRATPAAAIPVGDLRLDDLPADPAPLVPRDALNLRITGIGGTGVVTVAQVLATAAMLDGYEVRGLDQIGLSQKAGPVVSDLRFRRDDPSFTNRLGHEQADVLLAFDLLVAASEKGMMALSPGRTIVVGSSSATPTGAMVTHPEISAPTVAALRQRIGGITGDAPLHLADADSVTNACLGDAQTANVFVVGMAFQAGALPLRSASIEEALRLNGVAVDANLRAFRLGRRLVLEPELEQQLATASPSVSSPVTLPAALQARIESIVADPAIRTILARNTADLIGFQNARTAGRYLDVVERTAAAERALHGERTDLTLAVARNLHKLTAYKDEYEVARLLLLPEGRAEAERLAAATGGRISYRLHPPLLASFGLDHKIAIPGWATPVFRALARGKWLRGTALDPFGHTTVRRTERSLVREYTDALGAVLPRLTPANHDAAVALAELPDLVRGYERLKLERTAEFRTRLTTALVAFAGPVPAADDQPVSA